MSIASIQLSFPETVSDSLGRNSSIAQPHSFISGPFGWSQTIPQVKKPDVEVHGYTSYSDVRPVGRTTIFSETTLETAYGR